MDEETIKNAGIIAAVICRVVDYHAATAAAGRVLNDKTPQQTVDKIVEGLHGSERAVAVAIENAIDAGALK